VHSTQIKGPRGTSLKFKIASSTDLQSSNFLFTRLGKSSQTWTNPTSKGGSTTIHYIDSTVRVTGVETGFSLDIPVRFVKKA